MGLRDTFMNRVVVPGIRRATPEASGKLARLALGKAVDGVGPLTPAAKYAERRLESSDGNVERAIGDIISHHTRLAAAEGFVTNLGGLASRAALVPANVLGIAVLQCRMVAAIAHLRGYDLNDSRVRTAIFATMLGSKTVRALLSRKQLPSRPREIATGPHLDEQTSNKIAAAVTSEIVARSVGRSTAGFLGRAIPGMGGFVGGTTDAWTTRQIGKYAKGEHT